MRRPALLLAFAVAVSTLGGLVSTPAHAAPGAPSSSVAKPVPGQRTVLTGALGSPGVRSVELQKYSSSRWSKYASGRTQDDGSYRFEASTTASSRKFRVYARAEAGLPAVTSDEVVLTTQKDIVSLSIARSGGTGVADGVASPKVEGRSFALQYKSGSSWKQVGSPVAESANGTLHTTFPLDGTRSYRWAGASLDGSPAVHSPTITFSPGPKSLGKHVIYVTTDSGKTPTVKGVDYTGTAVIDGGAPLELETVAVRGNSTAGKPKKPYKLKFADKQSPFGLKKDKTWVLLANYGDHTLVRSKVAWDLADQMNGLKWTPDSVFTELFLNGKYMGSYQLVQSIKIDKDRVNVDKKTGVLIEIDPHFKEDGVPGFFGNHKLPYAFKDPDERKELDDGSEDPEGVTDAKVAGMRTRILNFEKVLYGSNFKDPVNGWTKYLDLDSAVDYYLIKEFTKDNDADFYRSNYFFTNSYEPSTTEKLFLGPVWDFDRSAGAKPAGDTTVSSPKGWWMRGNGSPNHSTTKTHWYVQLTKDPAFQAALKQRWAEKRSLYKAVADSQVDAAVAEVGTNVAANDRALWGKSGDRYPAKTKTYAAEVNWVKNWYEDRYEWMDDQLS